MHSRKALLMRGYYFKIFIICKMKIGFVLQHDQLGHAPAFCVFTAIRNLEQQKLDFCGTFFHVVVGSYFVGYL